MADKNPPSSGRGAKTASASRDPQRSQAHKEVFDQWLEQRLHQIFDNVVAEELPQDLMQLLERMRAQNPGKEKDKK
jgi:hypothetical protein